MFFKRFPVVPKDGFWHNHGMPKRAEKNAELPTPVPCVPPVQPAQENAPRPRELGGPSGPEPTRYGDWEKKGRCIDF